jgi:hypothetical protein
VTTPAATKLRFARARAELDRIGPTGQLLLVGLIVVLGGFAIVRAVSAIQPNVTIANGLPPAEAPITTAPPVDVVNPLQAQGMPPVSPEARRLIKTEPGDPSRLLLAVSVDIWRQMSPPFAAPGVDLCSWRLTVSRDTGHIVATPESDQGIPLFDLEDGPCAPQPNGNVVGGSATGGTIPTVSSTTVGPASGPSR